MDTFEAEVGASVSLLLELAAASTSAMRVLVTGATGFIGSHLVRALKERGVSLSAIIEPNVTAEHIKPYCDRMMIHDLRQAGGLSFAADGHDVVFHLAAFLRDWGPYRDFEGHNVEATKNLFLACRDARCERFLFLSSLSVEGFRNRVNADDSEPLNNLPFGYPRSKAQAERFLKSADTGQTAWSILRPGFLVFGPGDVKTTLPICNAVEKGHLFFVHGAERFVSMSYVGNLVEAIVAAGFSSEASWKTLIATDDNLIRWRDIFLELGRLLGVPVRIHNAPHSLAYALGWINEAIKRFFPAAPVLVSRYRTQVAAHDCHWKTSPLLHELGYRPKTSWRQALGEAVAWYKKT